ncbi:MAG: hypothetical protein GY906_06530 [bacterium]|nr:hypothetical protein [bacterium]
MAFLDPNLPIATCQSTDCSGCSVADSVHCHFRPSELAHFLLICMPTFLVGGAAIFEAGWIPLVIWITICVGFFGAIEIRVMCSHCPHYAEEGATLKCWANHGSPKIWKYRPGPMSTAENIVFFAGLVVVWGYPLPFFVLGRGWFLLGLYVLLAAGFFATLKTFLCSQCMNFACPLNGVPDPVRAAFFDHNPVVAEAWRHSPGAPRRTP